MEHGCGAVAIVHALIPSLPAYLDAVGFNFGMGGAIPGPSLLLWSDTGSFGPVKRPLADDFLAADRPCLLFSLPKSADVLVSVVIGYLFDSHLT